MGKLKLKEPLAKQAALMYNLLRKVDRTRCSDLPSVKYYVKEIAFTLEGGMLFLFMIIYVRQSRKDNKQ